MLGGSILHIYRIAFRLDVTYIGAQGCATVQLVMHQMS